MGLITFLSGFLAVQAVPKLYQKLGVDIELPEERALYGKPIRQIKEFLKLYNRHLKRLLEDYGFNWWDVYKATDIGKERISIAEEIKIDREDTVYDAGCGKGYFTIAAAMNDIDVVSLDIMNGYGRTGWWRNFRSTMSSLGLSDKVTGLRASASSNPIKEDFFSTSASIHAIRNFSSKDTIVETLKEMRRVTKNGGKLVVVENIPEANNMAQEAHLSMYNLKTSYIRSDNPYFSEEELVEMFQDSGLTVDRKKKLDFKLSYAPPIFTLNKNDMPEKDFLEAKERYLKAVEIVRKHGEQSPPALYLEAIIE